MRNIRLSKVKKFTGIILLQLQAVKLVTYVVYGRFVGERDQEANTVADRKEPLTALL